MIIENEKELIKIIAEALADPFNKDKKLSQIFFELGIDTNQIADERTMSIISDYLYYASPATPPAKYNNEVWYYAVVTLGQIFNTRLI